MFYLANVPLSGPDGSTTITDLAGSSWVVDGNAQIQSNALLLDGSGDFVRTSGSGFAFSGGPFEIGIDVKTTQSGERALVDLYSGASYTWQLGIRDGKIFWYVESGSNGGYPYIGTAAVNDGNWYSIKVKREGNTTSFYIDGVLDGSITDSYVYVTATYLALGAQVTSRSTTYDLAGSLRNFYIAKPDLVDALTRSYIKRNIIGWDRATTRSYIRRMAFYPVQPVETKMRSYVRITRGVPPWWGPSGSTTQLPTYKLRGRVMQRDPDGVLPDAPVQYARVVLFFRRLHTLVDIQLSDVDGYVQFDNLMPGGQAYYAIAFDPEGAPLQNAVIWDRLTPEPGP